jgi:uncharacterized protein
MKALILSDVQVPFIYSPAVKEHFGEIDLAVACGDLSYEYLEYVVSSLDVPMFYVRGNHSKEVEETPVGPISGPGGAFDMHARMRIEKGLLLAGIEGCLRYRGGPFQYSQLEMWMLVLRFVPHLLINRLRYGRFLDIFITHAPPWGIHDQEDLPHQGIKAFRWLINVFQPAYHFHGHIHVYRPDVATQTKVGSTLVVNTYGYRQIELDLNHLHLK